MLSKFPLTSRVPSVYSQEMYVKIQRRLRVFPLLLPLKVNEQLEVLEWKWASNCFHWSRPNAPDGI